jgi:hypothetical protein
VLQTHLYPLVRRALSWSIVGIVLHNGRRPTEEFLNETGVDGEGFIALIDRLLKAEPFIQYGGRFKKLRNVQNVFQLATAKERILGFRWQDELILTNGFRKKGNETRPDQIGTCVRLGTEFHDERKQERR